MMPCAESARGTTRVPFIIDSKPDSVVCWPISFLGRLIYSLLPHGNLFCLSSNRSSTIISRFILPLEAFFMSALASIMYMNSNLLGVEVFSGETELDLLLGSMHIHVYFRVGVLARGITVHDMQCFRPWRKSPSIRQNTRIVVCNAYLTVRVISNLKTYSKDKLRNESYKNLLYTTHYRPLYEIQFHP